MKETPVSSFSVREMLALIRASLWQTSDGCLPLDVSSIDWNEIGKLAMQQTVGPLVFDAALRLPQKLRPQKDWIFKAYSIIERNRHTHALLDASVAEVCSKLSNVGIKPTLLKGQAYARVYPDPTLRQCGDIDLYVGEENFRQAYEAAKDFGWECDDSFIPNAKHYACFNKEAIIELHRVAAQLPSRSADRRFQQWCRPQLLSGETIIINGEKIQVPTPIFDVIFVFMHLYYHFINGGIGLRQICDWTMLLHYHRGNLDADELERLLREFDLLKSWQLFAPIAVGHLGLPEAECPLYSSEYQKGAGHIMSYIIKEGNFGRAQNKTYVAPKAYLARKAYSFCLVTSRLHAKLMIDPKNVIRYFGTFVTQGSRRFIKEILTKK